MKEEILSEIGDMIRVIQSKTKRVVIVINIIFLFNMNRRVIPLHGVLTILSCCQTILPI